MTTERLVDQLVADLAPVRLLRGADRRALAWAAFALLCVGAGAGALGFRPDLAARLRDPAFLLENASLLLLFALAARSAFHLSVPGAERATTRPAPLCGLLAWALLLAFRAAADPNGALPPHGAPAGWSCVARMTFLAIVPAIAGLGMLRRAAPLARGWAGLWALFSAGGLAILGTQLLCPKDGPGHVVLWHLVPLLITGLLGLGLGRWLLRRPATLTAG
jgi:hypothetical protein